MPGAIHPAMAILKLTPVLAAAVTFNAVMAILTLVSAAATTRTSITFIATALLKRTALMIQVIKRAAMRAMDVLTTDIAMRIMMKPPVVMEAPIPVSIRAVNGKYAITKSGVTLMNHHRTAQK